MRIMPFMKRKKGVQFAGTGFDEGGGTTDYDNLSNRPQIGGVTLTGNKTLADLGAQSALTFDNAPTENSNNPVKSGGVYSALQEQAGKYVFKKLHSGSTITKTFASGYYNIKWDELDNYNVATERILSIITSSVGNAIAVSERFDNNGLSLQVSNTALNDDISFQIWAFIENL